MCTSLSLSLSLCRPYLREGVANKFCLSVSVRGRAGTSGQGFLVSGPQALMRAPSATPLAPTPGQDVGVVAQLGDGLLRRVLGKVVAVEGGHVVLAVPDDVFGSEEIPLERHDVAGVAGNPVFVNLVKVPLGDITKDFEAWGRKAPRLEGAEMGQVMMLYYSKASTKATETSTESMHSAEDVVTKLREKDRELEMLRAALKGKGRASTSSSSTRMAAGPTMRDLLAGLRDGELDEEDDDEEADDDEMDLKKMAGALKSPWGAEKEKEPEKVTETDLLRKLLGKEGGPSDYETRS